MPTNCPISVDGDCTRDTASRSRLEILLRFKTKQKTKKKERERRRRNSSRFKVLIHRDLKYTISTFERENFDQTVERAVLWVNDLVGNSKRAILLHLALLIRD